MDQDQGRRERLKLEARTCIDAITVAHTAGRIDSAEWQRQVAAALSTAYLQSDNPRWQSGFDGDPTLWRAAREFILDAVPEDGALLDIGCATGHLMESLEAWAAERDRRIVTFGLEIDPALAVEARRRLPAFADRIFSGNVSEWVPPRRFAYVRTGLEYVPPGEEPGLIQRLLVEFVEPGGRLIVGPMNHEMVESAGRAFHDARAAATTIASESDRDGKTRYILWSSPG